MRLIAAMVAVGLISSVVMAQRPFNQSLNAMKIEQKLGAQVPADARFKDETGKEIPFADVLGKRPVVLLPMFLLCRGVCGKEIDNLLKTVAKLKEKQVGRDFDIVFLSINPKETPELAMNKKTSLLKVMRGDTNREGYHFLTGRMGEIRKVTDAVGFGFDYDESDGRINHPAGLMVLSPSGKVIEYILGADYPKPVLSEAIVLAEQNQVGKIAETVLLGCVMIDPVTGQRSIVIENVIRLIAGAFAIGLFGWIASMTLKNRRDSLQGGNPPSGGKPSRA